MNRSIFKEYDIRGIIDIDWNVEDAYDIGRGIFSYFLYNNPSLNRIVIGMDGRVHSEEIKKKLIQAAHHAKLDVIDIGLTATPVLYSTLYTTKTTSGLMITASHNPGNYNGIKICLNRRSIWGKELKKIATIIQEKRFYRPILNSIATVKTYDANSAYINYLKKSFTHLIGSEIPVIFDCANGAAGSIMPDLVKAMEWKNATLLFEEVDGTFPNHEADPTVKKNMTVLIDAIKSKPKTHVGIGFDGDADRMGFINEQGDLIAGDQLLALFAQQINWEDKNKQVICDIKCSQGLAESLKKSNINVMMVPSGHSIIKSEMEKTGTILGGELSCHFFFADRYFGYDDGIYAALRMIEILQNRGIPASELFTFFPQKISTAEIRISCGDHDKVRIIAAVKEQFYTHKDAEIIDVDGVRVQTSYGWGLMRASNTESHFCFRFESDTLKGLKKIQNNFIEILHPLINTAALKEKLEQ
ncbi:phosphomannomutase/phosphoglucomutase [Candidatus Babeliales bacterium]|nr:phosphomannomutase/phosphoglucomutase [Candidatus Babeliales bacterium]